MNEALSPAQDAAVRAIVADMLAQVLHGAGDRIAEAINGAIVLLPVIHLDEVTHVAERHHG
ncbi:hypothetical protein [Sphingomonas sp. CROZ-RG-20F-R02-07]|uniref:hypothetical protein n=1 Tax=Sphingomonas sp. CROZ-RG-20F-R02-07 TaxID=2914832 RepID=UPI001F593FFB|nr:hypothetical protein [Sphingomonas sp. CROZ-RG-20F-R02-07]